MSRQSSTDHEPLSFNELAASSINHAMRLLALFILGTVILSGCVTNEAVKLDASESDDILVAVFRHVSRPEPLEMEGSHSLNRLHHVYFVAFWGSDGKWNDPNPRFLDRFRDFAVPVKPFSAALRKDFCAYDKVTGERGAVFYFDAITRSGRDKAEVTAGLAPGGGLTGSSSAYRVVQRHSRWIVISQKLKTIS